MSGYIGTQPVPQATQTRDAFTATSGQTSFATSGYTPNFLDVFLNGVKLSAADYTASNGSDVVLATGAATGDILEVVAYTNFDTANVTGAANFTVTGSFTSQGIDDNANATAITIDSSENVLVGQTTGTIFNSSSVTGLTAAGSGSLQVAGANATVIYANRQGSDGAILGLYKAGSSVGSIGVAAGDNLYIGSTATNHGGIYMNDTGVLPMSGGSLTDNTRDLGGASNRWNDLFLGGGVYLGGTGAANKLDDYEEGTWTPGLPHGGTVGTIIKATYTKVGNLVNAYCNVYLNPTNNTMQLYISGLPFVAISGSHGGGSLSYTGGMETRYWSAPLVDTYGQVYFHRHDASTGVVLNNAFGGASRQFIMQVQYIIA